MERPHEELQVLPGCIEEDQDGTYAYIFCISASGYYSSKGVGYGRVDIGCLGSLWLGTGVVQAYWYVLSFRILSCREPLS
mmetsp:Transcript_18843/g.26727  ORF Transcript_18843/g.26727 Transcript_18843/m.26727 type:complete len:80 (+) Transcript_18843:1632-1871(+)